MRIGIPKETKFEEKRIALAPAGVDSLVRAGHTVYVQKGAGLGSNFTDEDYKHMGAQVVYSAEEVFQRSECIAKVARLTPDECFMLQENQIIFSFLHLSVSEKKVLNLLLEKKITAISYELIENDGDLPILHCMSEIAGQMAVIQGARYLESTNEDSRGVLIGGLTGVAPAAVVILGAGVVGYQAAKTALGMGAQVIVLDKDLIRLRKIEENLSNVTTVVANPSTIARGVKFADMLIGAVLIRGEKTPHLVTDAQVRTMKQGAVIVDVSIDQGGCIETSRPTSISDPVFRMHGVFHCCIPNLPALVSRTASYGLTNSSIEYIHQVADKGLQRGVLDVPGLAKGVCTHNGYCSNEIIASTFDVEYKRIHFFSNN